MARELCVICAQAQGLHETDAWNGEPSPICDGCIGGPTLRWDQRSFVYLHVAVACLVLSFVLQAATGAGGLWLFATSLAVCWVASKLLAVYGYRRVWQAWRRI